MTNSGSYSSAVSGLAVSDDTPQFAETIIEECGILLPLAGLLIVGQRARMSAARAEAEEEARYTEKVARDDDFRKPELGGNGRTAFLQLPAENASRTCLELKGRERCEMPASTGGVEMAASLAAMTELPESYA